MITKAMFGNSENENLETAFKRYYEEDFVFNTNSTTENQITVGQRFHDHVKVVQPVMPMNVLTRRCQIRRVVNKNTF